MKKCEGTSAFSEENPRDCRKKPAGETEKARAQRNHGVELCFHPGILSMRALENDDCRMSLPDSRQEGKLLEARYSQLKLFQVHGRRHRRPDPCFTKARKELAQQLSGSR
jgi:hypothetical protein